MPANSNNPISTRTRQATSVPVENSEGTTRRERISPHPPHKGIKLILTFSSDEGTPYQSGGVGRLQLRRNKATGPPPTMTFRERVVTRVRRLTSAPVEKSGCTPDSSGPDIAQSDRQFAVATRRGLNTNRNQAEKMPPARLPVSGHQRQSIGELRRNPNIYLICDVATPAW